MENAVRCAKIYLKPIRLLVVMMKPLTKKVKKPFLLKSKFSTVKTFCSDTHLKFFGEQLQKNP